MRDEPTDDNDIEEIPPILKKSKGIAIGLADVGGSSSGLPPSGPNLPVEGAE